MPRRVLSRCVQLYMHGPFLDLAVNRFVCLAWQVEEKGEKFMMTVRSVAVYIPVIWEKNKVKQPAVAKVAVRPAY